MLEGDIKKEPQEEEEDEADDETDGEEEEGKGGGGKGLTMKEVWKLQHTEEGETEPEERLGKTGSRCYTFVVCSDSSAHCTHT